MPETTRSTPEKIPLEKDRLTPEEWTPVVGAFVIAPIVVIYGAYKYASNAINESLSKIRDKEIS